MEIFFRFVGGSLVCNMHNQFPAAGYNKNILRDCYSTFDFSCMAEIEDDNVYN